MQNEQKMHICR